MLFVLCSVKIIIFCGFVLILDVYLFLQKANFYFSVVTSC